MVVSKIFYFHPYLGKIPILGNICQMGWNSTTNQKVIEMDRFFPLQVELSKFDLPPQVSPKTPRWIAHVETFHGVFLPPRKMAGITKWIHFCTHVEELLFGRSSYTKTWENVDSERKKINFKYEKRTMFFAELFGISSKTTSSSFENTAVSIGEAWGQQPPGFCWKVKTVRCLEPSSAWQQIHQDSKKETNKWSLILSAMMKKKLCVVCYCSFGRGGWKGCIIFSFEFCEFELDWEGFHGFTYPKNEQSWKSTFWKGKNSSKSPIFWGSMSVFDPEHVRSLLMPIKHHCWTKKNITALFSCILQFQSPGFFFRAKVWLSGVRKSSQ